MFGRLLRKASKIAQPALRYTFATSVQGGNLYTWGTRSAGLGLSITSTSSVIETPHRVEEFNNNVARVAMGHSHSAVVTTDGDVYTFGYCNNGVLGHNEKDVSRFEPTLVEYFRENNIVVKDVVVGENHTAALTENGEVYTWGFGGKSLNPLVNLFAPSCGALGLGSNQDRLVPTLVEDLPAKIQSITSGNNFIYALDVNGEVYSWGVGKRSVHADETQVNLRVPTLNENLKHFFEHEHVHFVKIKAVADQILALGDNGHLYGWGYNEQGQLGVPKIMGVEYIHDEITAPTKIDEANLKGKNIVDFDLGQDISVILTDSNEVYWAGLKLVYAPEKVNFPTDKKIKSVTAASPSVVALTEDGEILTSSRLIPESKYNPNTGIHTIRSDAFENGQILTVGGNYVNKFAVVRN
jgi:alpha-tubulin suppressor-like RCC1 family protein